MNPKVSRPKYLVLTCDTEALPGEAAADHVERLIWGRFPGAPCEAGIGKMMDVIDGLGMKMTFFLDVFEQACYGEAIDRAARCILDRGHDLQLHLHIEFLPGDFWPARGWRKVMWAMNLFDEQATRIVLGHGVELFEKLAGRRPLAFRAGAFRYSAATLKVMGELGIPLSFHYYPVTAYKPSFPHGFDDGVLPPFRWSNGVIEVPVGLYEVPPPRNTQFRYYGFEFHCIKSVRQAADWMNAYWARGPEFNVFVMVLHSWAFLERDAARQFVWKDTSRMRLFHELLAALPADVRVITASELHEELKQGRLVPARELPIEKAGMDRHPLRPV